MIAQMDQVTVVGRRRHVNDVLAALQNLGVVQVETLQPTEADGTITRLRLVGDELATKETWDRILAKSTALLDVLGVKQSTTSGRHIGSETAAELEARLTEVGDQIDRLVAERAELRDEYELTKSYLPLLRDLAPMLAQLEGSTYLTGVPFMAAEADIAAIEAQLGTDLSGAVAVAKRPHANQMLAVAAVLKSAQPALKSALAASGVTELALPERHAGQGVAKTAHVMEERSLVLPKRLAVIEEELARLASQHGERLAQLRAHAGSMSSRYHTLEDLVEGRYGFALRGWVPSNDSGNVVASLTNQFANDLVIETRLADEHHDVDVPVKLDNPAWVRPFQGLLSLFAPPKYGSFDPSWTLAVFFPLYFGMVVGDIGFGLLFALVATLLRRRGAQGKDLGLGPVGITIPARALGPIGTVIYWCAAWSVAWGAMFGEFFGNFLEHFPSGRPVYYTTLHHEAGYGLINIPLFRVEVFTPLLLLSIGFGVLQVLSGWVIRVIQGVKHRDMKHVYEGIGMFSGLTAIVVFAASYLNDALGPVTGGVVVAGMAIFVVCAVLAKMPLMALEIISNSGHILSYLRLFAVGLSAALVANLATDLGFGVSGVLPVIGPILGIVVALFVHSLAIALTIIGHTLQPLRLQYVEFFTKFGFYDDNGRPYTPFKLVGGR